MNFGPRNAEEERIFAEESFRIDIQVAIHELMLSKGISQRELARRMRVSEQRVSQIFSDECNVTVRTLAKVFHALGEQPRLTTASQVALEETTAAQPVNWNVATDRGTFRSGRTRGTFRFTPEVRADFGGSAPPHEQAA